MSACGRACAYLCAGEGQGHLPHPSQSVPVLGLFFAQWTVRQLPFSLFCVSAVYLAWGK